MTVQSPVKDDLTDFLAGHTERIQDPYGVYTRARAVGRLLDLDSATVVTRYEDVATALRNDRLSNQLVKGSRLRQAREGMDERGRAAFDDVISFQTNFLSRSDGDKHGRLRKVAHRYFTPGKVAQLRESCATFTADFLDAQPRGEPFDFMYIAYQVPLLMIGQMLGIAPDQLSRIHSWSVHLSEALSAVHPEPYFRARTSLIHFGDFVNELMDSGARADNTALIGTLLQAEADGTISREEISAMIVQMLFAGHETTTTLIGSGLLALQQNPAQWQSLVDDPTQAPRAVEELMRHVSPTQFVSRVALDGATVAGTPVEPGRTVVLLIGSAHRDPDVFTDPDALRLDRNNAGRQIGFGLGRHFCLGAALARLEGEIVIGELARRFPSLRLVGDDLEWTGGAMLRRLRNLTIELPA